MGLRQGGAQVTLRNETRSARNNFLMEPTYVNVCVWMVRIIVFEILR